MVRSERAGGRRTVEMVASAACLDGNGDRIPHPLHGDVDGLPSAEPCPRIARIEHVHLDGAVCNGGARAQLPGVSGTIAPRGGKGRGGCSTCLQGRSWARGRARPEGDMQVSSPRGESAQRQPDIGGHLQ